MQPKLTLKINTKEWLQIVMWACLWKKCEWYETMNNKHVKNQICTTIYNNAPSSNKCIKSIKDVKNF